MAAIGRITYLPPETQSRIQSSVQINTLGDVILELIKNSLDAGAKHIDIHLDFLKGFCSVEDDGHGILKNEFLKDGGLARLNYTSRTNQSSYGQHGRFLAHLSGVSLLSITSRHASETSINSIRMKDGLRIASHLDTSDEYVGRFSHGTKVVVHNLFGKLPVRVKFRHSRFDNESELVKEFLKTKKAIVGLVLATSKEFTLDMHDTTNRYLHTPRAWLEQSITDTAFNLNHITSTLLQAALIKSTDISTWHQASIHTSTLSIRAAISIQPIPTKTVQFISLNQIPLSTDLSQTLLDQVNTLFDSSDFGLNDVYDDEDTGQSRSRRKLLRSSKQIDKWPQFYIRIESEISHFCFDEVQQPATDKLFMSLTDLLRSLISEFLHNNGFRFNLRRRKEKNQVVLQLPGEDPSGFQNWSRIKSGSSTPCDVLSGLPFVRNRRTNILLPDTFDLPMEDNQLEDIPIVWTNPRTGSKVHINPRTGMALPSSQGNTIDVLPHKIITHRAKRSEDVVESLARYLPSKHFEAPLQSVMFHESLIDSNHSDNCAVINDENPVHITGPGATESVKDITKHDLKTSQVVAQVDSKFILVSVENPDQTLLLIDQHAADERIKVEKLFLQLCNDKPVTLPTPVIFEIDQQEINRLQHIQAFFEAWEIHFTVSDNSVRVSELPSLIVERCRLQPELVVKLIRHELWRDRSKSQPANHWLSKIASCPQGILDMIISRACRSAIMFNDQLNINECHELVHQLSDCSFPFQCAHGRPSLSILACVRNVDSRMKESTFGEKWKAWDR